MPAVAYNRAAIITGMRGRRAVYKVHSGRIPMSVSMRLLGPVVVLSVAVAGPSAPGAQLPHTHHGISGADATTTRRHVTMEELHRLGGIPRGWKFTLPAGDVARGKHVFVDAGCYKCHTITGAGLPEAGAEKKPGPELTGMGSHHPAEYFAESILAPNAVIVDGPGFTGPDRLSIMPSYADSLSVQQLLDVVAFLKGQTASAGGLEHHMSHDTGHEATAGDYTIRLVSVPGARRSHVVVLITDRETGEAVPYLPVTVTLKKQGDKPTVLRLAPMMGADGFHYGVDATIPDDIEQVSVSVGRPTMKLLASAKGRFARPVTVTFDW
jgi:mono/diheme cytochrome c family protein